MTRIDLKLLLLMDIIICFGGQAALAKKLKIEVYLVNGWVHRHSKIDLEYAVAMRKFYLNNGYVVLLMYGGKVPSDQEIKINTLYLYSTRDSLVYAVKNKAKEIKRIQISYSEVGNCFFDIQSIVENKNEKNNLSVMHFSLLSKITAKNGYHLKKGYQFSSLDLSTHVKCVSAQDVDLPQEKDEDLPLSISERVIELRADMSTSGRCRGRKKKKADEDIHFFRGRTVELLYAKHGFKSLYEYYRAARVVDCGDVDLINAMDKGVISISKAAQKAKLILNEKKKLCEKSKK